MEFCEELQKRGQVGAGQCLNQLALSDNGHADILLYWLGVPITCGILYFCCAPAVSTDHVMQTWIPQSENGLGINLKTIFKTLEGY